MPKPQLATFAGAALLLQPSLALAQEPGVAGRTPAAAPALRCDAEALQKLAPPDTTVAFAAREGASMCRANGWIITRNPGPNRVNFVLELPDQFNGRYLFLGVGGSAGQLFLAQWNHDRAMAALKSAPPRKPAKKS